jgi:hypothetical protein
MSDADGPGFPAFFERALREPIYVILGVQGSGTNLFRRLVDRALNFSVVQDQSVVYNAALKLGPRPTTDAVVREFNALKARMLPSALGRKTLRRVKSNGSFDGIDRVFEPSTIRSGGDLARFIYAYTAYSRDSMRMAIKSDDLWETIEHIDEVLPNRRIILLTRDFRDNLLSITNKDFGPRDPLVAAAYVKQRFARYDAEYQRTPEERRFHVTFEELLDDPDGFLGRFYTHFTLGGAGDAPTPVDTGRIRRNNTRKWASLTPRQLAHVEGTLRGELTRYGYEPETQAGTPPGAAAWLAARTRDTLQRIPQKLQKVVKRLQK